MQCSVSVNRFKKYKQAGSHSNSFRLTNGRSDDTGKTPTCALLRLVVCAFLVSADLTAYLLSANLFILERICKYAQLV